MYILVDNGVPVAQIRFELKEGRWLIGYSVAAASRGKGYGTKVLSMGMEHLPPGRIAGQVKPVNSGSVHIFRKLGFHEQQTSDANGDALFEFWLDKF